VGGGGELSYQVRVFRVLLLSDDPTSIFLDLTRDASPAGKLYGICGLYLVDPNAFEQEQAKFEKSDETVTTFFGCEELTDQKVSALFREQILDGSLPQAFKRDASSD